jgi:cob(I)alamin adenosyltransferase
VSRALVPVARSTAKGMKIYTRTGDDGSTGLFGGGRVDKDSPRVEAFGAIDELNACLGVARAALGPGDEEALLGRIQAELFTLGAELSCAPGHENKLGLPLLGEDATARLEAAIDAFEAELSALDHFILPSGTAAGAALHLARTVCRRAERRLQTAGRTHPLRRGLLVYLNRLSDFLFVLARRANAQGGVSETPWAPRRKGSSP